MRSRSSRRAAWRRCRAPTSGPTARPSSTMSSWSGKRARRRDARELLHRPADVPGRQRRPARPVRRHRLRRARTFGIDFEAEVAVVTGDVPMGASAEAALEGIRLVMLANDVSLRNLIPAELAKGFGFFQSKPATAFSPVAVTPDELGAAWQGGRVHLDLESTLERRAGRPLRRRAGDDVPLRPADRAHRQDAQRARRHRSSAAAPSATRTGPRGYSCIAEKRAIETIEHGAPQTAFMRYGDRIRIEMKDARRREPVRRDRPGGPRADLIVGASRGSGANASRGGRISPCRESTGFCCAAANPEQCPRHERRTPAHLQGRHHLAVARRARLRRHPVGAARAAADALSRRGRHHRDPARRRRPLPLARHASTAAASTS